MRHSAVLKPQAYMYLEKMWKTGENYVKGGLLMHKGVAIFQRKIVAQTLFT